MDVENYELLFSISVSYTKAQGKNGNGRWGVRFYLGWSLRPHLSARIKIKAEAKRNIINTSMVCTRLRSNESWVLCMWSLNSVQRNKCYICIQSIMLDPCILIMIKTKTRNVHEHIAIFNGQSGTEHLPQNLLMWKIICQHKIKYSSRKKSAPFLYNSRLKWNTSMELNKA